MNAVHLKFDTAKYDEFLAEAGITADQAKAHRLALAFVIEEVSGQLATDQRLTDVQTELTNAVNTAETRLGAKLDVAVSGLKTRIANAISDQTWKLITAIGVLLALQTALNKIF